MFMAHDPPPPLFLLIYFNKGGRGDCSTGIFTESDERPNKNNAHGAQVTNEINCPSDQPLAVQLSNSFRMVVHLASASSL